MFLAVTLVDWIAVCSTEGCLKHSLFIMGWLNNKLSVAMSSTVPGRYKNKLVEYVLAQITVGQTHSATFTGEKREFIYQVQWGNRYT